MRNPFGKKVEYVEVRAKPKKPRLSADEQQKEWALKEVRKEVALNPALKRQIIISTLGLNIKPEEEEDPVEKLKRRKLAQALENDPQFLEEAKEEWRREREARIRALQDPQREIDNAISEMARKRILEDPQLQAELIADKIKGLMTKRNKGTALAEVLNDLDEIDEVKRRLGGNRRERDGDGGKLITSEVISKLIDTFGPLVIGMATGGKMVEGQPVIYVVDTPNGPVQMSQNDFQQYQAQKQLATPQPKHNGKESPATFQAQETKMEETPQKVKNSLNLTTWVPFIGGDPVEFVNWLLECANKNDDNAASAKFGLNTLIKLSSSEIIKKLETFKSRGGEIQAAIEKLEANIEWLEAVKAYIKQLLEEEAQAQAPQASQPPPQPEPEESSSPNTFQVQLPDYVAEEN